LLLAARLVAEHLGLPRSAAAGVERADSDPLDEMILLEPIGDDVADGADLEPVGAREILEVAEPRHRTVVAHNFANDGARVEASEARNVDGGLGMAGADEHGAGPGDEREGVAGRT